MTVPSTNNKTLLRVLLIEDNPGDADLIQEYCTDDPVRPIELIVASTLGKGLSLLDSDIFDVILLDLNLPDSTGMDTFNNVHNSAPDIPLIVVTGNDDEIIAEACIEQGAQDYLSKQLVNRSLARTIWNTVARVRTEADLFVAEDEILERIKEMKTLYSISSFVAQSYYSIPDALKTVVEMVPPGWKYSEIACSRITYKNMEFPSGNFKQTRWKQSAGHHGNRK